jgi:hypothetical protein
MFSFVAVPIDANVQYRYVAHFSYGEAINIVFFIVRLDVVVVIDQSAAFCILQLCRVLFFNIMQNENVYLIF